MHLTLAQNLSFIAFSLSSIVELILCSQKAQKCGHFLSNLVGIKILEYITLSPETLSSAQKLSSLATDIEMNEKVRMNKLFCF